ncbi:hypothetical protein BDV40DRAFT_304862 [Aspergillus tamarii]|uniref:Uncharacterized protein n=1 Tax=Aspergillus tamarii TaxID=41984 RepID=A0A5N6UGY1_ASPTM|nr:hypothetical protein BDV40DRAFT_304862 [Aspergillus tamarii]
MGSSLLHDQSSKPLEFYDNTVLIMDEDVPREPKEFWREEYTSIEHSVLQTITTKVNWSEKWLKPVEISSKKPEHPEQIYLMIQMVATLLMNYFPEDYGWKFFMDEIEEEVVYIVECHDGEGPIDHLMVLVMPEDHHVTLSIQKFKKIYHTRYGITPQDEDCPALMWGAIFQGPKALFYQYEKGGGIRALVDPGGDNGPYCIRDDCDEIHYFLKSMSHRRSSHRPVSWKGLARNKDSNPSRS